MFNSPVSQQVSWWEVHEFVAPRLEIVGAFPMLGTREWCQLDAGDPKKIAALLDGAQHWALRVDSCQEARCEASKSVAAAADWSAIGAERLRLDKFYEARPGLKRVGGGHV